MTQDTDFTALFEEYCTTAAAFDQLLSVLLGTAHGNGIDVSGAWEAYDNGTAVEWDVVVTPLLRDGAGASSSGDDAVDSDEETN